ncbi:transposable element Tc1 transposase [Trichonephila clavipes]|nr:transposable element Tc1 transposase [Trichonephila clavipes]
MAVRAKFMLMLTAMPPSTHPCTLTNQNVVVFASIRGSQPGVMVWGAISFHSRTLLVLIRGTFTVQWYVDNFLRTVLLPFLLQYPGHILKQDRARPHIGHVAMNCLAACQTLLWSARSLSPIEHLWDMMGRPLRLSRNVDDLALQLEQIWQEILQDAIRVLYHSMLHHAAACIQPRGGSTPY